LTKKFGITLLFQINLEISILGNSIIFVCLKNFNSFIYNVT